MLKFSRLFVATMGALLLLGGAAASIRPQTAFACSVGPDFDPITASEIIVGGYITDWRERPDLADVHVLPGMMPVEIDLRVDHTWKGAYDGADIVDWASFRVEVVENTGETMRLWGAANSCGAFGEDPAGMYVVFGLSRDENGNWHPGLPTTFYLDGVPYDASQVAAYGRSLSLPVAGSQQPESNTGWPLTSIALASAGVLATVALTAAWVRQRRGYRAP